MTIKKVMALLLSAVLITGSAVSVHADPPSAPPDGNGPGGGGPGGSSSNVEWSGATEITSATTTDGETYSSTEADQNAVLINTSSGVAVTLNNPTVTKSGGTSASDDYSFYGINSAVMCKGGGTTTINGGTVTTSAAGANGVFCYGANNGTTGSAGDGTTVNISDVTITTTGDGSGGIMTTYGGTTNASNLTVSTSGGSSAAIRTDRGGGTVTVDGGSYTSSGTGSPAIYSVADVTVKNATLVSEAAEGAVMEGGGDITLNNCDLTDTNSTANSQAKFYDAVMLYQSFSGDATGTESIFKMTGGSLTCNKGHVFHVTNVTGRVVLNGVTITNNDSEDVLISVCDDGWSGASNTAYLTAEDQVLSGTALVGSDSSLTVNLTGSSTWTGKTSGLISDRNGSTVSSSLGTVNVYIGEGSVWKLSGDCSVSSLGGYNGTYGSIDFNGHTLTVGGTEYSSGSLEDIKNSDGSSEEENGNSDGQEENDSQKENGSQEDSTVAVSDNKAMDYSSETRDSMIISYNHSVPFWGKSVPDLSLFGDISVTVNSVSYNASSIKVNKKKKLIQITGLAGADKATETAVKKATKGSKGLSFSMNPYYVKDTDNVSYTFSKSGKLKYVSVLINNKKYKTKKAERSYDSGTKVITFTGENLRGSYTVQ